MAKKKKEVAAVTMFDKNDEGRHKALQAALEDLTKRFGDGTIMSLGEAAHLQVDVIPTGSLGVDIALGVGGLPRGRITEIYGAESSGKTTLCLHVIREAQKRGGICAFVDMEHALDPSYAERIGVNLETLYVSQPDTAEQALEIVETLVRSGAMDAIVVDSVAALVPRAEIEGEMGDSHVGLQARLMSQALRKLTGAIKQSNVSVIFTNQLREKVGVMFGCLHHDSLVQLADGSTEKIGTIVQQKLDVEVMSYNVESKAFEPCRIVNWFDNGVTEEFLHITVATGEPGQTRTLVCTTNHTILTDNGYVAAGDLEIGDHLVGPIALPQLEAVFAVGETTDQQLSQFAPVVLPIVDIELKAADPEQNHRYDIEVEGHHCYIADGIVVHNSPETQPGGRALKFYASVRLDIRRVQGIKSGEDDVGSRARVKVKKNKVAPPFKECEFDIMFTPQECGISKAGEIVDLAVELGIIEKRGAFFRYNETLLGQGRENTKQYLVDNPAVSEVIESAVRQHFGLPPLSALPVAAGPVEIDEPDAEDE